MAAASRTSLSSVGCAEEGLGGGQGGGKVLALMASVQVEPHTFVGSGRGAEVQGPAAHGQLVVLAVVVPPGQPGRLGLLALEDGPELRIPLAQDQGAPRFDDPGLLARNIGSGGAEELHVVQAHVGHHRDLSLDHVGGVPASPQPHLENRHVHRAVGEPQHGGCGQDLEPGQAGIAQQRFDPGEGRQHFGQLGIADGLPVSAQSFVDGFEMRAGERPDPESLGREQGGEAARRGRLAIGAGHMDSRGGGLGMTEYVDHGSHTTQVGHRPPGVGEHPLHVLMAVQPGQGIAQAEHPAWAQLAARRERLCTRVMASALGTNVGATRSSTTDRSITH